MSCTRNDADVDIDSPVGKNFVSIIRNRLDSIDSTGDRLTSPLPAPLATIASLPPHDDNLPRPRQASRAQQRPHLTPSPESNPFNTYTMASEHTRFPVGSGAAPALKRGTKTHSTPSQTPAGAIKQPGTLTDTKKPAQGRGHRGTGKSISFADMDFVKMFEGDNSKLGNTPPKHVENEITEEVKKEEKRRRKFRRDKIELFEKNGEGQGGERSREKRRSSVPPQTEAKTFRSSSHSPAMSPPVEEPVGFLTLSDLMRPRLATPLASSRRSFASSPPPPILSPPSAPQPPHSILSPPSRPYLPSMEEKLTEHYTTAAENAALQKRARTLSVYQGCFLVVFLFLLYMLSSVLSYSIWFSDELSVIDSLLVAVYTITTVGYGNQQPTSNPALAFTIWEMLSGIALLTMMVAQVLQASKVVRESREEDAKNMEKRIDKSIEKRLSVVISPPKRMYSSRFWGARARCALMGRFLKRLWRDTPEWAKSAGKDLFLLTFTVAVGAISIGVTEGWSFVESVYFAVTTMTTVGYGDLSPETNAGKILTMCYMPFSLYFMSVFLNLVANFYIACHKMNIERILKKRRGQLEKFKRFENNKHLGSSPRLSPPPLSPIREPDSPFSAQELGVRTISTQDSTPSPDGIRQLFNPMRARRSRQGTNSTENSTHSQRAAPPIGSRRRDSLKIDTGAAPVTPKGYVTARNEYTEKKKSSAVEVKKTPVPPRTPKMSRAGPVKTPRRSSAAATPKKTPLAGGLSKWKILSAMTPSKIRARVQSRFEMIIASELAGERGGLQIEGEMIGVQFLKFKAVVTKWFVPKNAIHAFRAVSYEAIVGIGEFNLMKNGTKAYTCLDQEDRVLMFAPLVGSMGTFEAMTAWLKGTDFVEKNDKEEKNALDKLKSSNYGYALSPDDQRRAAALQAKPRHKRAASTTVLSPMKKRIEAGRGWKMSDFSSTPSNLKSPKWDAF